jgi:hypothetical protein
MRNKFGGAMLSSSLCSALSTNGFASVSLWWARIAHLSNTPWSNDIKPICRSQFHPSCHSWAPLNQV